MDNVDLTVQSLSEGSSTGNLLPCTELLDRIQEIGRMGYWTFTVLDRQYSSLAQSLWHILDETVQVNSQKGFEEALAEIVHPNDWSGLQSVLSEHLRKESKANFRIPKPDGSILFVFAHVIPIFDDQLNLIGHVGFFQDVTTRVGTEQKLKQRDLLLEQYQTLNQAILWEYDPDMEILRFSGQTPDWFPIPVDRDYSLPQFIQEHIHSEDQQKTWQTLSLSLSQGGNFHLECRIVVENKIIPSQLFGSICRDDSGIVSKIVGTIVQNG